MRTSASIFAILIALAACGERERPPAAEARPVSPALTDGFLEGAGVSTFQDLCREAVEAWRQQAGDAVTYVADVEGATLFWMVEGRQVAATCKIENDVLTLSSEGETYTAPVSHTPQFVWQEAR